LPRKVATRYLETLSPNSRGVKEKRMDQAGKWICIRGARTHNLHNIDLDLPRERLSVLTGPSGSGKSSLAFDTLFAEGQRRYLETLRGDTRALFHQLQKPDVDVVEGLPPTLCVSQRAGPARARSTLATLTEIHDHLRLLWARLGTVHCPTCGMAVTRHTVPEIVRETMRLEDGRKVYLLAPLVRNLPGEHKETFQYIRQNGFLRARVDEVLHEIRDIPEIAPKQKHTIDVVIDRLVIRPGLEERLAESLAIAGRHGQGRLIVTNIDDGDWHDRIYSTQLVCSQCDLHFAEVEPRRLHFNNPYGACPRCTGLGQVWDLDPAALVPDRTWSLARIMARLKEMLPEELLPPAPDRKTLTALNAAFARPESSKGTAQTPLDQWPDEAANALLNGSDMVDPPWPGLIPELKQRLTRASESEDEDVPEEALLGLFGYLPCPECQGTRLNLEARSVRFAGKGIHEVTALSVDDAVLFFASLEGKTPAKDEMRPLAGASGSEGSPVERIRAIILREILTRLRFLQEVGLGYLTLDRPALTLSGGEAQRARLATYLGGGLLGVCYILDEPTIGLHPRDTGRLLHALRHLQARGNTVIIVEHDEAVIRHADYLVDIGPGAGKNGGRLLAYGAVAEVLANPASVTAPYLRGARCVQRDACSAESEAHSAQSDTQKEAFPAAFPGAPRSALPAPRSPLNVLRIRGAREHNLKNIDVAIPLGKLVCITGVSGSGKSTLARDILCHAVRRHLGLLAPTPGAHAGIDGLEHIDKIIEVDQSPLGRSSRSSPATYTGIFDEVRKVFAATRTAKIRGYKANRFSFNVKGGRCDQCLGQGSLRVAMQFLPDLNVPCPACQGKRFNRATLEVLYKGKSIADVLALSVAEAVEFFANLPMLKGPLNALNDVGLGYMPIGQPSTTLSGGEAQRVKLAAELARTATGRTLFLLDEPTTGLHFADVARLLGVLQKLVEAGNTLVVIEHHLDLIAAADWVIDLGPEGGQAGGYLVVAGPPEAIAACPQSITGPFLVESLRRTPAPTSAS